MADLPQAVAEVAADLGHAPLQLTESFVPSFACPTCGSRADFNVTGWTGWAVEQECDRVLRTTGSSASGGAG